MKTIIAAGMVMATLASPPAIQAQSRSVRDTETAYGARLTAKGQPADLNENRVNNRLDNRINNRLSLRIERYRPDTTTNPITAFEAPLDDKSRRTSIITPPPSDENPR